MNDYKDKYSVSSDNTLREKQYEIKNISQYLQMILIPFAAQRAFPLNGLCMNYYQNIVLMN